MKPAPFDYLRAGSVEEAAAALAEHGDEARVLAGGQSLVAMLNMRLLQPAVLVDVMRVPELCAVRIDGDRLEVGAAVTQAGLERWPRLRESVPLLALALPHVGHVQTRARGTVCGSIAHSDPSSELPLCLRTLGGEVVLRSAHGRRVVPAEDFQLGLLSTAREPHELVTAVRFPLRAPGSGHGFREFSIRHGDFAIVAVAACVSGAGARIGVGGGADRPQTVAFDSVEMRDLEAGLREFAQRMELDTDAHASADYRRQLVLTLGRAAVKEALECMS